LVTFYGASTTIVFKLQLFRKEIKRDKKNKLKFILIIYSCINYPSVKSLGMLTYLYSLYENWAQI